MGNALRWSLDIPEALAAHPDLGDLPPEEEEAINEAFMGTVLCPRQSITLLLPRSCYCYTMALDQPAAHPNPPRRVACRAADGRAVTYRQGREGGREGVAGRGWLGWERAAAAAAPLRHLG